MPGKLAGGSGKEKPLKQQTMTKSVKRKNVEEREAEDGVSAWKDEIEDEWRSQRNQAAQPSCATSATSPPKSQRRQLSQEP